MHIRDDKTSEHFSGFCQSANAAHTRSCIHFQVLSQARSDATTLAARVEGQAMHSMASARTCSSLSHFMHLARQRLASFSPATVLVVGNESADLDSCVSSIAFAVLRDIAQTASAGEVRHIPIVNVDRSDLHLRKELSVLLPVVGLSMDDLICRDELPREAETERTNWALVDHNHFRVRNVSADNAEVVAVVDHHVDEGLYLSAEPRLISTAGSCTSLVLDHFKRLLQPSTVPAVLSEIAMIAQATIRIDTSNLREKANSVDLGCIDLCRRACQETLASDDSGSELYSNLLKAKRDSSGLDSYGLYRRDYKEWELGEAGTWGISSVVTSLDDLVSRKDWFSSMRRLAHLNNLAVHLVMTKHGGKELVIRAFDATAHSWIDVFLRLANSLELERLTYPDQPADVYMFRQRNRAATRKEVAVICQKMGIAAHDQDSKV